MGYKALRFETDDIIGATGFQKDVALTLIKELKYFAIIRREGMESKREYFISPLLSDERLRLRVRCVALKHRYNVHEETNIADVREDVEDAWIREIGLDDRLQIDEVDEVVSLIWGFVPNDQNQQIDQAKVLEFIEGREGSKVWEGQQVFGLPGKYHVELKNEPNALGRYTITLSLIKTRFMPEGYYNDMEFDFYTGLLISSTKIDKNGYIEISLEKMEKV